MQRVLGAVIVAMGLVVVPHAGAAEPVATDDGGQDIDLSGCVPDDTGEWLICKGGHFTRVRGGPSVGSDSTSSAAAWPPPDWAAYDRVTFDYGDPCVTTDYRPPGVTLASDVPQYDGGTQVAGSFPRCPSVPSRPLTAAEIAARYWEAIPLPKPKPAIAPGWAITGKLAYLETNGTVRHTYTNSTAIGPLEIVATGGYYVDWGDGESSGPYGTEGTAWPDGQITHDYIWSGTYDIVVTERWTATWSLGGHSGTLRELRTSGRIDGFPVRQIQAVVR